MLCLNRCAAAVTAPAAVAAVAAAIGSPSACYDPLNRRCNGLFVLLLTSFFVSSSTQCGAIKCAVLCLPGTADRWGFGPSFSLAGRAGWHSPLNLTAAAAAAAAGFA